MIEIKRNNGSPVKVFAETFEYEAYDQVKALNKLYVEITNGRWIGRTSDVPQSEDSVEYIRKDYLLKWAKERYQQTISNVECYTGHSVWAEVIEKLESL